MVVCRIGMYSLSHYDHFLHFLGLHLDSHPALHPLNGLDYWSGPHRRCRELHGNIVELIVEGITTIFETITSLFSGF